MKDPIESVDPLDTKRFMGTWYVIAHIPPFLTNEAYNAVERYRLEDDGTVDVLYTYNDGGFDGKLKTMTPTGYPDSGDADGTWGMRFVWPLKSDYRIAYIDADYTRTIVARNKRDYVWIMARTPELEDRVYSEMVRRVEALGYDVDKLRKVPQQPLNERTTPEVARDFENR